MHVSKRLKHANQDGQGGISQWFKQGVLQPSKEGIGSDASTEQRICHARVSVARVRCTGWRTGTWGEGDTAASRCWLKAEKPVDTAAAGGAAEAAGAGGWDASDRARWMTVVCCGCSGCCACHMPSTCGQGRSGP